MQADYKQNAPDTLKENEQNMGDLYPIVLMVGHPKKLSDGGAAQQTYYSRANYLELATLSELADMVRDISDLTHAAYNGLPAEERSTYKRLSPYICWPFIGKGASAEKEENTRRNPNIAGAAWLALDFDELPQEAFEALTGYDFIGDGHLMGGELLKYDALAYTTASDDADTGKRRLRVVVRTRQLITPEDKSRCAMAVEWELMNAIGGKYIAEESTKTESIWLVQGGRVALDKTQHRAAQVLYLPFTDAVLCKAYPGEPVDFDQLPDFDTLPEEYRARQGKHAGDGYALPASFADAVAADPRAQWLVDNGYVTGDNGRNALHIRCANWLEHSDADTRDYDHGDTGSAYMLHDSDPMKRVFMCHHASCGELTQHQTAYARLFDDPMMPERLLPEDIRSMAKAEDFPDLPEAAKAEVKKQPRVVIHGRAAFLTDASNAQPFSQWSGATGDARTDKLRQEVAELFTKGDKPYPLRFIPPVIRPKFKDGELVGFNALNHADNLKWMIYKAGVLVARNMMTFQVETFDRDTGAILTPSEAKTRSFLVGQAAIENLPKDILADHYDAVSEDYQYHPVTRLLYGRGWDGVPRVQRVIDCVPVAEDFKAMRDALLIGAFVAVIAAIDDGKVSMKFAPVLFSEENDYFKTTFIRRISEILPGSYKEGVSVDPTNKDSVRKSANCLIGELGELDSMTKRESAPLKAWLPLDCDEWRPEHSKTYVKKPRQTVFIGTANKDDLLKDPTIASRFPVIPLTGPIDIDTVNEVLGWKHENGVTVREEPEALIQFWLEVRAKRAAGASHVLDVDTNREMKIHNDQFVDKGMYYDAICGWLETRHGGGESNGFPPTNDWLSPSEMALNIGAGSSQARLVGRALTQHVRDGNFEFKRSKYCQLYRVKE